MKHKPSSLNKSGTPNRRTGYWEFTETEWETFDIILDKTTYYLLENFQREIPNVRGTTWGELYSKPDPILGKGYEGKTITAFEALGALIGKRYETYRDSTGIHRSDISVKQFKNLKTIVGMLETGSGLNLGLDLLQFKVVAPPATPVTIMIKKKLRKEKEKAVKV